ncbi:MAG: 30S ribosomal protein S6 [Chlamydiae bacterium]|nr:30S ribosomal protein S6 [Chlamydiota bacterium]MBI3266186.1 30S ribosomal protein S6 [Chlamydiota bacterium]
MKNYETMMILDPALQDAEAEKWVKGFETELASAGGSVQTREIQGKKMLSYKVKGFREGTYVLLVFQSSSEGVRKMESKLRTSAQVLRYLLIKN